MGDRRLMMRVAIWLMLLQSCGRPNPEAEENAAEEPAAEDTKGWPATAKVGVWQAMRDDLEAPRHPSDGGGTVEITEGPDAPPAAGSSARWRFTYRAGPRGIAVGGALVMQAPPFWGWSPPQDMDAGAPGYTTVSTSAEGVSLVADMPDRGMLRVRIDGRALSAGETIELGYGVGALGATVDRYTEASQPIWFAVDGDGDGIRKLVDSPPVTAVKAGPARSLVVQVPTTRKPGEPARLTIAAVDGFGNMGPPLEGRFELLASPSLGLPSHVDVGEGGRSAVTFTPTVTGVHQVVVRGPQGLEGVSGPLVVHGSVVPVLWGDLQVHTGMSDGSGALDDVYAYARDVAGLDVVAITDHDHWGMRFLDDDPAAWRRAVETADRWNATGGIVAFAAYEWTHWIYGHRHVLYGGDAGPVFSSLTPETSTPQGLWKALSRHDAITIAHHSAGGPVAVDWRIPPDPAFEPVTEVCSVHGSSESADTPGRIYDFVKGNSVRDALMRGYVMGLLCSTDGHDGHPGMAHLQAQFGGLAGIITSDRTRQGVFEALRARRVYGTNGVRLLLRARAGDHEMGSVIPRPSGPLSYEVRVVAGAEVTEVAVVRGANVVETRAPGVAAVREVFELSDLSSGEFVYVRVRTADGGVAWSSPIWIG